MCNRKRRNRDREGKRMCKLGIPHRNSGNNCIICKPFIVGEEILTNWSLSLHVFQKPIETMIFEWLSTFKTFFFFVKSGPKISFYCAKTPPLTLQIGKGVHQGCILSPCLFNLYAEYIMRNAGLEETQAGIKIAGRNITSDMQMTPPLWQKVKKN